MDSIRENEKLEDMITTLEAELNADIDDRLNIVLVEGSDDIKFVNHIMNNQVICYESFSGKRGIQQLIEAEELQDTRIIGIRDRDYESGMEFPERLFFYDTCCMETMMLSAKECIEGILDIYYKSSASKSKKESLCIRAMRELAPLSVLREENERRDLRIDFERARISDCMEEESEKIQQEGLFEKIQQEHMTLEECQEKAGNIEAEKLPDITNGHDICRFLGKVLKTRKGDLGEERFRDLLLSNYRKSDFKKTQLYSNLKSYQEQYQRIYVD